MPSDSEKLNSVQDLSLLWVSKHAIFFSSTSFSEDEVREAAREAPPEVKVGEIKEPFGREDRRPPSIDISGHGPWSDDMLPLSMIIRELARHRRVDLLEGYMFARIDGHEVHGKPMCGYAARRAIEKDRRRVDDGRSQGTPYSGLVDCGLSGRS